jgi:hypothetical protein
MRNRRGLVLAALLGLCLPWWAGDAGQPPPGPPGTARAQGQGKEGSAEAPTADPTPHKLEEFVAATARSPQEVEQIATLLVHKGLYAEARKIIELSFKDKFKDNPSPVANILTAQTFLFEYELGRSLSLQDFGSPLELLKKQLAQLELAEKAARAALDGLDRDRRSMDAERYRMLRSTALVLRARILMTQGDVGYRLQGASLVGQITGGAKDSIAMAQYGVARQILYEALLLEKNATALDLASAVESRVQWLKEGRYFGGLRFFEVDPVMGTRDGEKWTPLAELEDILKPDGTLVTAQQKRAVALDKSREAAQSLVTGLLTDLRSAERKKQERLRWLAREVSRLQQDLAGLKGNKTALVSKRLAYLRQEAFQGKTQTIALDAEKNRLRKEQEDVAGQLQTAVAELSDLASKEDLRELLGEAWGGPNGIGTLLERFTGQILQKLGKEPALADALTEVKKAWQRIPDKDAAALAEIRARIDRAQGAIKEVLSAIETEGQHLKEQIERLAQAQIEKEIAQANTQIEYFRNKILEVSKAAGKTLEDLDKKLQGELQKQIDEQKERILGKIKEVQGQIENARRMIDNVQQAGEDAVKALMAARTAILAAGNIPSGIITGMANGVITGRGSSLIEAAKAAAEVVRQAQVTVEKVEEARDRLRQVQASLEDYRSQLRRLDIKKAAEDLRQSMSEVWRRAKQSEQTLEAEIGRRKQDVRVQLEQMSVRAQRILQLQRDQVEGRISQFRAQRGQKEAEKRSLQIELQRAQRRALAKAGQVQILLGRLASAQRAIDEIDRQRDELKAQPPVSRDEIDRASDAEFAATNDAEKNMLTRIAELEKEAKKLQGSAALDEIEVPAEGLLQPPAGESLDDQTREVQRLLDTVNQRLFSYANWLFLVSQDREALQWAISATSVADALTIYRHLVEIDRKAQGGVGRSRPRYFSIFLSSEDLQGAFPVIATQGFAYFTVAPHLAGVAPPRKPPTTFGDQEKLGDEPHSVFYPLQETAELLFAPLVEVEQGTHHILWDVWVVPQWKDAENIPTNLRMVGLEPAGPTVVIREEGPTEMPVRSPSDPSFSSTSYSLARVRAQHQAASARLADPAGSLIDGTLHGMNYRQVLGRGLGNSWKLVLPQRWSSLKDLAPGFERLQGVQVIFGYLSDSSRRKGPAREPQPRAASGPIADKPVEEKTRPPVATQTALEILHRQEDEYQADRRRDPAFEASPAGQFSRVQSLRSAFDLLPSYNELCKGVKDDPAKSEFLDYLAKGKLLPTSAVAQAPGAAASKSETERLTAQAEKVIADEMLRYTPSNDLVGPIELGRIWDSVEYLLRGEDGSLLAEVKSYAKDVEDAAVTLEGAVKGLGLVERVVERVDYDRQVSAAQRQVVEALARRLDKALAGVKERLEPNVKRWQEYHAKESWYGVWMKDRPDVAQNVRVYLVTQELRRLREKYAEAFGRLTTPPRKGPPE